MNWHKTLLLMEAVVTSLGQLATVLGPLMKQLPTDSAQAVHLHLMDLREALHSLLYHLKTTYDDEQAP